MPDQTPLQPNAAQTLARYRTMLAEHDWSFEHSDDQRVWRLGRLAKEQLEFLARELDPDYAIWNSIAPEGYRRKPRALDPRQHFDLGDETATAPTDKDAQS